MDPNSADLGKLFFAVRDYSFVGILSLVFLINIFSTGLDCFYSTSKSGTKQEDTNKIETFTQCLALISF
jgi:hypothetical protein